MKIVKYLSLSLVLGLYSCGDDSDDSPVPEPFSADVSVRFSPSTVEEGQNATLEFVLSESNATDGAISVGYIVTGDAGNADVSSLSRIAIIPVGESRAALEVTTLDDDEVESDEILTVEIDGGSLSSGVSMGSPNTASLTIRDNEPTPPEMTLVTILGETNEIEEGESATVIISLSQANDTGSPIEIDYLIGGTATEDDDYTGLSGSVNIANGASSVALAIATIDDDEIESVETIIVSLRSTDLPENFDLGDSNEISISVTDNDITPDVIMVMVNANSTGLDEDGGATIVVELSRINDTGVAIEVGYDLSGTATEGEDYEVLSGTVNIADGEQSATFNVMGIDDIETEDDETIIIELSTLGLPEGMVIGIPTSVELTIMDDDEVILACSNDNSIDQNNFACNQSPTVANSYNMSVSGGTRTIITNGVPEHDFRNQVANLGVTDLISDMETYTVDATPSLATSSTSIVKDDFTPNWKFGVAVNGVPIDPAPGTPFIFTNANTGEYNWDWVFEPTNNMQQVGLDCNITHLQPDQSRGLGRIHYHGDMAGFADDLLPGIGSGSTTPTEPLLIGWAADGFPIVYKYGPSASGNLVELQPSYSIKSGQRSGDGISEPCGEYNGKYTNDYEYSSGIGDLDECNGISQSITVADENFNYFYVITEAFPVISRCMSGTPDQSFKVGPG